MCQKLSLITVLALNGATAWAVPMTPTSQERFVFASTSSGSETFTAADFSPFSEVAFSENIVPPPGTGTSRARAEQSSVIDPFFVDADITTHSLNGGIAHSKLDLDFSISAPTPYSLTGEYGKVGTFNDGFSVLIVRLTGPSGNVVNLVQGNTPDGSHPIAFNGTLAPGNYTLLADVQAFNISASTTDAFTNFTLSVPEPTTAALLLLLAAALRRHG